MHPSSLVPRLGIVVVGFFGLNLGCGVQPMVAPSTATPDAAVSSTAKTVAALEKEPATRVLACQGGERSDGKRTYYAVDYMTRKLQSYPSLAEYAGLESVSSCDEALAYVRAYDQYSKQKPKFESESDPKASANAATAKQRIVLPHLKVNGGDQLTNWGYPSQSNPTALPSPIVKITQVSWFASGELEPVRIKVGQNADGTPLYANEFGEAANYCTGTFLNRHWILTAAHCMAAVQLQSIWNNPPAPDGGPSLYIMDGGQPGDKYGVRVGVTSYMISWPDSVASGVYSETTDIFGVTAYQFPHESYDNVEQDESVPPSAAHYRGHTPDIALLYLPPWNGASYWLAADVSKGAAVYIKAEEDQVPNTLPFRIAGYGSSSGLGPDFRKLTGAAAPVDLTFADPTYPYGWDDPKLGKGGFGGALAVLQDGDSGVCHGDSGGPLYVDLAEDPFETPTIIQYGISTAMYQSPPAGDPGPPIYACSNAGNVNGWMRLEKTKELIAWINGKMGSGAIAKNASEQDLFNKCRPDKLKTVGNVYRCWGDPCSSSGDCPDGQTCVGAGMDLIEEREICHVCPLAPDIFHSCECVRGQCMRDPSKQAALDAGDEEQP